MVYPAFVARFYDVVYQKVRTIDHDYYVKKILEANGPVLEIGTGTGRFFKEMIEAGADMYGIDANQSMLDVLRKKIDTKYHSRIFHQRAEMFQLNKKFDLIIAPFRVFSHLITIDEQLRALDRIAEHLDDNGSFIFDLFIPDFTAFADNMAETTDFEGEYEPGKILKRLVSAQTNRAEQVRNVTMKFVWEEDGSWKSENWTFPMRYFFRYELENLVARSQLKLAKIYGDFSENEITNESKDFVVVCKKLL